MIELCYFCDVEEERIVMATAGVRPVVDLKLTLCRWDRDTSEAKGDFPSFLMRCLNRKDHVIRVTDFDCADLQAAVLEAKQQGRA